MKEMFVDDHVIENSYDILPSKSGIFTKMECQNRRKQNSILEWNSAMLWLGCGQQDTLNSNFSIKTPFLWWSFRTGIRNELGIGRFRIRLVEHFRFVEVSFNYAEVVDQSEEGKCSCGAEKWDSCWGWAPSDAQVDHVGQCREDTSNVSL